MLGKIWGAAMLLIGIAGVVVGLLFARDGEVGRGIMDAMIGLMLAGLGVARLADR